MVKKTVILFFLFSTLFSQNPARLVEDCAYKVEEFILSRDIMPKIAIASVKNHSLRNREFIENIYQLLSARLSDYLLGTEGVIGFDSTGGFFSPPPGYDYLLKVTYKEVGGESGLYIRIYSSEGKFEDFISCTSPVAEFPYREMELSELTTKKPLLLWEVEIEGRPLAVYRLGDKILLLYPEKLVVFEKRGGFLVQKFVKSLSWPKPFYPSLDPRGLIAPIRVGDSFYLALGISTSVNYIYVDPSKFSVVEQLPWIPLNQTEDKLYLGKFSPGKNYFMPEIAVLDFPQSLPELNTAQSVVFVPFYDFCIMEGMINIIDYNGRRRVFKDEEEVPSPEEKMGDEIECWKSFFIYSGFLDKEKLSFRDFRQFGNQGEVEISGKIINMSSEGDGTVIVLVNENGRYWVKEFKIE